VCFLLLLFLLYCDPSSPPPPPATRLSFRVKMIDTSLEAPKTTGDLSRPPLQVVVWGPTPVKSTPKLLERQHKSFDSLLLFIFSRVYIKECQLGIFPFFLDTFPILSQQTSPPPPHLCHWTCQTATSDF
jgi:hypothetical protein